ncbi:MAG: TonB-dependent receptor [Saprospiraceae bacterium]
MQKLLLLALLFCAATAAAQNADSVRLDRLYYGTIDKILDEITAEHKIKFVFDRAKLAKIRYEKRPFGQPLFKFLDAMCRQNELKYMRLDDGSIRILGAYENPETDALRSRAAATARAKPISGTEPLKISKNITVSGKITDYASGEALPFVSVRVRNAAVGTTANVDGQFTLLNVPTDTSSLIFSYVGYDPVEIFLTPDAPLMDLNVTMSAEATIAEVVITAEREELLRASEQVSMFKMTPAKLSTLPSLGEKDIFRSFQLMPGISAANEHTSGLYVRGGTPDQALTLYDGFTVYNVDHLFGFFSAFNSNSIKDVQLYKGVFDAKYGGRLSSVVEITGKDGNNRRFNAGGDLSLLSANIWMEQPFGEKFTTILTARRSWKGPLYNKIFDRFSGENQDENPLTQQFGSQVSSNFYDINAKATWKPNASDVFSLSFYNGADNLDNSIRPQVPEGFGGGGGFNIGITDVTNWGNTGASLKWSRRWSERLYSNTLVSFSNYFSKRDRSVSGSFTDADGEEQNIRRGTLEDNNLNDVSAKTDWEWKFLPGQQLEFGVGATQNDIAYTYSQSDTASLLDRQSEGLTATAYLQNKSSFFKEKLSITPGVRVSHFSPTGKIYYEPRANMVLKISEQLKFKAATGRYYQFAKRVIREDILSGSRDFWVLADDERLPVASSDQYVAGFSWENRNWLFDVEAYYKTLDGISEYSLRFAPGAPGQDINYEESFYNGTGVARGIDFLLQKKYGKFNGWLGYTLGEARHNFPIYGESDFYAANDVTHEFKAVALYKFRKWDFSATWIYASGKPYTAPEGGYQISLLDGTSQDFLNVSAKNAYRLPAYHRFDVAATLNFHWGDAPATLGFSIFNLYNRKNVWYKEFEIIDNQVISTDVNYLGLTPNVTFGVRLR